MTMNNDDDIDDVIVEVDKTGRPTDYSPEVVKTICDNVAIGMTFKDSANLAGVKKKTAEWWLKVHPEFSASYARAKLKRKQRLVTTVRSAANDDWRAALEMLARLYPHEWGKMTSILVAKQTDKAAELMAMVFHHAIGDHIQSDDDDLDGDVPTNGEAVPAAPLSETPAPVLLLPPPRDVSSGNSHDPTAH